MNVQDVTDTAWFHATSNHDWFAGVERSRFHGDTPPLVHVGTYKAALDRARVIFRHSGDNANLTVTLFEFRLSPEARVAADFAIDEENLWEVLVGNRKMRGIDAQMYINRYEDEGSISMLVNPDLLVLESEKDVTALI